MGVLTGRSAHNDSGKTDLMQVRANKMRKSAERVAEARTTV